ncbi:ERCC4 domain-containing protein [Mycena kentingensis (nom. inval.)]|nr:ERCC4 domain-containing protein [Mycena kentingensis (nom. inval.)]
MSRRNQRWLGYLETLRAKHEHDKNQHKFWHYARALHNLRRHPIEIASVEGLISVPFIGKEILKDIELLDGQVGAATRPAKARATKRSASATVKEAKRSVSAGDIPQLEAGPRPESPVPPKKKRSSTAEPDVSRRPAKKAKRSASAGDVPRLGGTTRLVGPGPPHLVEARTAKTKRSLSAMTAEPGVLPRPAKKAKGSAAMSAARLGPEDNTLFLPGTNYDEFRFWYLDAKGNAVRRREQAASSVINDPMQQFSAFRVVFPVSEENHPMAQTLLNVESCDAGQNRAGDMLDALAEQYGECPGFAGMLPREGTTEPAPEIVETNSVPSPMAEQAQLSRVEEAVAAPSKPAVSFPKFPARILRAGTYDVKMLLDHRERVGGRNWRDMLAARLPSVAVAVAALELGDVVWVAQDKSTGEQFMLDVILERKRLDDLVASIQHERFREQKFRLKLSGMTRIFYVVEEHNSAENRELWGPQIATALSATQVVDGLFVKQTDGWEATVEYLVALTEEIAMMHKTKDLRIIPSSEIQRHSYLNLQHFLREKHPKRTYTTSFADFQMLNRKSGHLTVLDAWARMLLCVRLMSAEKVRAVVERYPAPRVLYEVLRKAEKKERRARRRRAKGEYVEVPEARELFVGIGGPRDIGRTLSGKLYDLFTAVEFTGS